MTICSKCKEKFIECQLCKESNKAKDTFIIKNKINGKELRICKKCGKTFNWISS